MVGECRCAITRWGIWGAFVYIRTFRENVLRIKALGTCHCSVNLLCEEFAS